MSNQSHPKMRVKTPARARRTANTLAYLGPEGTFSHLLALKRFGGRMVLHPCQDLALIFEKVISGETRRGLVPIENSSGGTIHDSIDLLIKHSTEVRVTEDLSLDVRLALLGRKGGSVRNIFSHFAPLHHHRDWLAAELPKAKIHTVSSTAEAARRAAAKPGAAALAAPGAARLYGLDVLRFPIRPEAVNVTRFYVLERAGSEPRSASQARKTAMIFRLKNRCGSLHAFLGPYARSGVNLRMIVSRPVPGHPEQYVFFVEIDGADTDPLAAETLRKSRRHCDELTVLGSFPSSRKFAS